MDKFKVIAFTHKELPLEIIGKLHLSPEDQKHILRVLKNNFDFEELLFLSTCNRIELFVVSSGTITETTVKEIVLFLNARLSDQEAAELASGSELYSGSNAIEHVLKVASSLESLVVGEREIVAQVRKAYDFCNGLGTTGDFIRLLIRQTIESAKEIYTKTNIAKNPVSVASLAYRQLRDLGIKNEARIVFVGSGETNTVLAGYFKKHKFANFTVFNRTLENAQKLSSILNGKALALSDIQKFEEGFDVLVVCTASADVIITQEIYNSLKAGGSSKKVVIDLGVPANVAQSVYEDKQVHCINIHSLKAQAEANMQLRRNEIILCEEIIKDKTAEFFSLHRERKVELAFGEIPRQVKAIKDLALNEVFAKEINSLDDRGKEVLDKVISYMEKKYNAVAIKTAKEAFLSNPRD